MSVKIRSELLNAFIVTALSVAACGPMAAKNEASLYDRLGGKPAITAVVDDLIANVAADSRINKHFVDVNIPRLKRLLVEQICAGSGGPCVYTGEEMKVAHKGMKITDAEFDAMVEDLVKSLDKFKVPMKEKQELLSILRPMRSSIVNQ